MRTRLTLTLIGLITLSLISCESNNLQKREQALKEKELELHQKELELQNKHSQVSNADTMSTMYKALVSKKRFLYVVIKTVEPKIISEFVEDKTTTTDNSESSSNPYTDGILPREVKPTFIPSPHYVVYSKPQYFTYTSDVIEVNNYTEDSKFIEQDKFEKKVQEAVNDANRRIEFEQRSAGKQVDGADAKIISRSCFVFDTYGEASRQRAQSKNVSE